MLSYIFSIFSVWRLAIGGTAAGVTVAQMGQIDSVQYLLTGGINSMLDSPVLNGVTIFNLIMGPLCSALKAVDNLLANYIDVSLIFYYSTYLFVVYLKFVLSVWVARLIIKASTIGII